MLTFVMLTSHAPEDQPTPYSVEDLESTTVQAIRKKCPEVEWLHNRDLETGSYRHIFITPDIETAEEVAGIITTFGHSTPELWTATDWDTYRSLMRKLPKVAAFA